jgi:hypothetical protein
LPAGTGIAVEPVGTSVLGRLERALRVVSAATRAIPAFQERRKQDVAAQQVFVVPATTDSSTPTADAATLTKAALADALDHVASDDPKAST